MFERWMRRRLSAAIAVKPFNLQAIAARVQRNGSGPFAAALLLYAHESGRTDELMGYIYRDDLRAEYEDVLARLGGRSVERLALRGTPMMSLPPDYQTLLAAYAHDYRKPERTANEKRQLWIQAHDLQLKSGISSARIANDLGLSTSNTAAYLKGDRFDRLSVDAARAIVKYLQKRTPR